MTNKDTEKVPFYKLFAFADSLDMILIVFGTVSAIVYGLAQPMMYLFLGQMINTFGGRINDPSSNVVHEISEISLRLVYLAIGEGAASFLQMSCWTVTGERQATRIRNLYLKTILRQDIEFFDAQTKTGEVIGRMSGDTLLIQEAMGEKAGKFIQLMSTLFGGFTIAFCKGWRLAILLSASLPILVMVGGITASIATRLSARGQAANANAGNVVEQTVGSIRTVVSYTGEKLATEEYDSKLEIAYQTMVKQGLASGVGVGIVLFILFSTYALAIWYGSKLILDRGYSGGSVINEILCIAGSGLSIAHASPCINAFAAGQAAAYKMFETIKRKPKIEAHSTSGIVLEDVEGEIELREVCFSYPCRPQVKILDGFSLRVPSGTTAALVGQSGSGKSTLISLLQRFYDPDSGQVLIDGVNLKDMRVKWIRGNMGLVSQEPILFATTIKENILYGKEDATDDEIRRAVELANAATFVDRLPQGVDTMVGERGIQLSGGQKQRIAIARAIVKNPKILLLDEATSALDAESERIVQEALDNVMTNRTTIVVAHRLRTIRNADVIAVVRSGKLVDKGPHAELIKDPEGEYARLVRMQEGTKHFKTSTKGNPYEVINLLLYQRSAASDDSSSFRAPKSTGDNTDVREDQKLSGKRSRGVSIRRLAYLNKPETPHLLLGSLGAGVHGAMIPVIGLLLSSAIKIFFEPAHVLKNDARFWGLMFVSLGTSMLLAVPVQHYFFAIAGAKLIQRIRSMMFKKVSYQEISWFDEPAHSSGAIGARLSTDATVIRSGVGDALALMVQNITTVIVALVIAFAANWLMAVVIFCVLPLFGLHAIFQIMFFKGATRDAKVKYEEASQVANDAVSSIRTVASFSAEDKVMRAFESKCEAPLRQGIRLGVSGGVCLGASALAQYCAAAFCFYIGAILVYHGKASPHDVFKVYFALAMSAVGVLQASTTAPDLNKVRDSAASILEILDKESKIDSSSGEGTTLSSVNGDIEFRNVSFSYPTRPDIQIFEDLCLSVPSGKIVALVGESGSGKSTIISLIDRFYDPTSGEILLDGVEIRKLNLSWLRRQMGLVSQEPVLFNETIRANIAYGIKGGVTEEQIIEASKSANAHGFVSAMPLGYDTNVGERGVQLSGGQKQRIAIARAILRDPKVLLLDEATSALDVESERIVQEALDRVMVNRTTVVVAHRLTTVERADAICVVKNGVVAEKGSHDELVKMKDGIYASLSALHGGSE